MWLWVGEKQVGERIFFIKQGLLPICEQACESTGGENT